MVETGFILLAELAILGVAYAWVSYLESKAASLDEAKPFLRSKTFSIGLFVLGIIMHTIGDAWKYELQFETAGHIIIMIGSIVLIRQTVGLWKIVEEFGNG